MAYIKKETVLEKVKKLANNLSSTCFAPPLMIREIENAPEVDCVEVVRCKDCKYVDDRCAYGLVCTTLGAFVADDSFCSEGTRKEGVTNG